MFDIGSIYPAALNVFDQNGNASNPTSVTLTITQPDGTLAAGVVVLNPPTVTGQFTYSFVCVQPGRHTVRWVTTVPNTAYTDVFDVAEQIPPSIFSLAQAKKQLEIDPSNTDDDDELREKCAAITKGIENYLHEEVVQKTIVEEHNLGTPWNGMSGAVGYGRGRLRLWKYPTIQLLGIVARDGSCSWNPANFTLDKTTGLLTLNLGPPLRGDLLITYSVGYVIIPYNYIEGAKVLLQHVWESRRGPGGVGGVAGPEELADYRHYTALPRKCMEWLGPPRPIVA